MIFQAIMTALCVGCACVSTGGALAVNLALAVFNFLLFVMTLAERRS